MAKDEIHTGAFVYRDFWFKIFGCLIASEIIDSLGREESIFVRFTTASFYIDLLGGFIIALLLWEWIKFVTCKLDKRYDWITHSVQRVSLQLFFGVITPIFLCFVFTLLFMKVIHRQDIYKTSWLTSEFYAVTLIIILINLIYFTWWLYLNWQKTSQQQDLRVPTAITPELRNVHPAQEPSAPIEVSKGNLNILLLPEEIALVHLDGSYSFVRTHTNQNYVTTYTLDELMNKLGETSFFRANRQVIISRKSSKAYKSIENGKIQVDVVPVGRVPVIISQKRAKDFRKWITGDNFSPVSDLLQP